MIPGMMLVGQRRGAGSSGGGGGGDGFPNYLSTTTTGFAASTTSHAVAMPASVASGDLLLLQFASVSDATHTTPSGWALLSTIAGTNFSMRSSWFYKVSAGTEGGTTVDVVSGISAKAVAIVHRIAAGSYQGTPEVAGVNDGFSPSTTPNPPSLSPSWGAEKTLWIAGFGAFVSGVSATVSVYPFADGQSHRAVTDIHAASCWNKSEVASRDPGTFTQSTSGRWVAHTIGVRPA